MKLIYKIFQKIVTKIIRNVSNLVWIIIIIQKKPNFKTDCLDGIFSTRNNNECKTKSDKQSCESTSGKKPTFTCKWDNANDLCYIQHKSRIGQIPYPCLGKNIT